MEDTRITFETAKLAKERGFDGNCYAFYEKEFMRNDGKIIYTFGPQCNKNYLESEYKRHNNGKYLAPTQSLLAKWLREEHNIHLIAYKNINIDGYDWCFITTDGITNINSYKTYEEAYEIGLYQALKLI